MKTIRLAGLFAPLFLAACEHGVDFDGTVIAPVDVQQMFSPQQPGQLFVVADVLKIGDVRDTRAVFCAPEASERSIAVRGFRFGCAEPGTAHVTAYAIPRTTAEVDCSSATALGNGYGPDSFDPVDAVAVASTDVPVQGAGGGGCNDGHFTFSLTLQRLAGAP